MVDFNLAHWKQARAWMQNSIRIKALLVTTHRRVPPKVNNTVLTEDLISKRLEHPMSPLAEELVT